MGFLEELLGKLDSIFHSNDLKCNCGRWMVRAYAWIPTGLFSKKREAIGWFCPQCERIITGKIIEMEKSKQGEFAKLPE